MSLHPLHALASALLLGMLGGAWIGTPAAWAHGGNFREADAGSLPDAPEIGGLQRGAAATTTRAEWLPGDWQTWWGLNRGAYLPDRRAVRGRARAATPSAGLFALGAARTGGLDAWSRALRRGALEEALPFLLDAVQRAGGSDEPEVLAAALLALGRIAREAPPVRLLQRFARDERADPEVRESAVLALGYLRRSEPAERLGAEELAGVRTFLLDLFDEDDVPDRLRAFAALSVAFLADQPYPDTVVERDGRSVTRALWQRLQRRYPSADLPAALLTALAQQPPAGVPDGVLEGLRAIAAGRPLGRRRWDGPERSHALAALARLGGAGWLPVALWSLRGTRDHVCVRAAAVIALAQRAAVLDEADRLLAARSLRRSLVREPYDVVRGLGQVALASLLRAELAAGQERLLTTIPVGRELARTAREGSTLTRPFAALGLGIAVHDLRPTTRAAAAYVREARAALADGLQGGRGADDLLGACAVGLGLAGAESAQAALLSILQDPHRGAGLRGHCAVALALSGRDTPALRGVLHAVMAERRSSAVHVQCVRALALLAPPETTGLLVRQLETTRARHAVAVVAAALGSLGDPAACAPILALARARETPTLVRTMCVVALGLLFDPEPRPSRVRLTTHANYPARTPSLSQAFNIQ